MIPVDLPVGQKGLNYAPFWQSGAKLGNFISDFQRLDPIISLNFSSSPLNLSFFLAGTGGQQGDFSVTDV